MERKVSEEQHFVVHKFVNYPSKLNIPWSNFLWKSSAILSFFAFCRLLWDILGYFELFWAFLWLFELCLDFNSLWTSKLLNFEAFWIIIFMGAQNWGKIELFGNSTWALLKILPKKHYILFKVFKDFPMKNFASCKLIFGALGAQLYHLLEAFSRSLIFALKIEHFKHPVSSFKLLLLLKDSL